MTNNRKGQFVVRDPHTIDFRTVCVLNTFSKVYEKIKKNNNSFEQTSLKILIRI